MFTGKCFECATSFTLYGADTSSPYCSCIPNTETPGQYLAPGNNTCTDLITCAPNTEWNNGANVCMTGSIANCASFTEYAASETCTECTSPWYLSGNACHCNLATEILNSTTLPDGTPTTECITKVSCGSRKYNPGDNTCPFCVSPNCQVCQNVTGTCTECINDSFYLDPADNICKCQTNQFINLFGRCETCQTNCTTCADSTGHCTSCLSSTN